MPTRPGRLAAALTLVLSCAAAATAQPALTLNEQEYFTARGLDVLVFNNWYSGLFSDSKLSGIELIHHGERTVTNGDVRLSNTPEQWDPIPTFVEKQADREGGRVIAVLEYPDDAFRYRIEARAAGAGFLLSVHLDAPLPPALEGRAGLNLEFLPSAYFGRSYLMDGRSGLFPRHPAGPLANDEKTGRLEALPLASGSTLVMAPDDPERRIAIEGRGATLSLYDGRNKAQNGWFVVRSLLPAGRTGNVVEWLITPNRIPDWTRRPVIAHSQVGYHPAQRKVAVIELDPAYDGPFTASLFAVLPDGRLDEVLSESARRWGRYLRYEYATFDFSRVSKPGVYVLEFGGVRTTPFRIADDVYRDRTWQSTLDTFFPVQMDHMFVNDRYRVWHGASHLDDARQAPVDHVHFDLYAQGPTTDTKYQPGEHIPGLDVGGWYDAGDFDIRTQSQYAAVLSLVHAREAFGIDWDQTTVDQRARHVEIGRPDGVPDIIQQIEHGTLWLISHHRAIGHAIPGVVEPTLDQYTHLGDAVTKTDGLIYDPALEGKPPAGGRSGVPDDRWAFTTRTTPLQYGSIAALAAASRVLRGHDDALARECLETAERVWDEEHAREPSLFHSGNTTGGPLEDEELRAAVELLITTGGRRYAERIAELWPHADRFFERVGFIVVRALPHMDEAFRARFEARVAAYRQTMDTAVAANPFGVPIAAGGWGGSGAVLGFAIRNYMLHKAFPSLVGPGYTLRALDFIFGTHPASDVSLVSGIGAHSKTIAYGMNRADYSFIPGGVVPGIVIVRPDLPELKEDWPFLWFESEYVITPAAAFIYAANAADDLVESMEVTR
ncbi:MAG TPA: glycoside hydrolase family 9 protein [Vicinamibacterales bacterium]|nr:glycoside hydrolase family 9 protein [Vicinamibacterales bacterium]